MVEYIEDKRKHGYNSISKARWATETCKFSSSLIERRELIHGTDSVFN